MSSWTARARMSFWAGRHPSVRLHSALGYRPPAPEVILHRLESPRDNTAVCRGPSVARGNVVRQVTGVHEYTASADGVAIPFMLHLAQ